MKRYIKSIISVIIAAAMVGCSTTEKFTVYGLPNTKIYSPSGSYLATIGANNSAKIEVTSDAYYAYLLSMAPGSNEGIPFALDYKGRNPIGTKVSIATGYTLAYVGAGTMLISAIAMILATSNGDSVSQDTFGKILGVGTVPTLLGIGIGWPADSRNSQISYSYQFRYDSKQSTNNDLIFSKPITTEIPTSNSNEGIKITPIAPAENKNKQQPPQNSTHSERWNQLFNDK